MISQFSELDILPRPIAYVPTMGALHPGHYQLLIAAKKYAKNSLLSIFVNPLQFENSSDLINYPDSKDADMELALAAEVDYLWFPKSAELYPDGYQIISAGEMGNIYEGASRPGHFDGMLTVVARYLDLIKPDFMLMGEKDFQQLCIVKKYIEDRDIPTKLIPIPTVRLESGLAYSSRNSRLSESSIRFAAVIFQALVAAANSKDRKEAISKGMEILHKEEKFQLDYFEMIDSSNFQQVAENQLGDRVICAGWIDGVRLIDNLPVPRK